VHSVRFRFLNFDTLEGLKLAHLVTILAAAIILSFTAIEFFDYRRINVDTSIVVDKSRGQKLNVRMNITFPRVPCYRESSIFFEAWKKSVYVHRMDSMSSSLFSYKLWQFTDGSRPVLSLDVMDISGETQRDISHNILKRRLDERGIAISSGHSAELRNDLDKLNEAKKEGYCGSCYGGMEPESGCCNTCDEVREAYLQRGWSFNNPDAIDQVRGTCSAEFFKLRM
jgi:hypothetical protein